MKYLIPVILLCISSPTWAKFTPKNISWPGWSISTYDLESKPSYPMTNLVDGNPSTTWAAAGKGVTYNKDTARSIIIEMDKPIMVDGIRIMNGYNKSKKLFFRNDRIVSVAIYTNLKHSESDKKVKTVNLSDKMDWHKISIPRSKIGYISINLVGIKKGRDNDICISEIQLLDHGRPIPYHMPYAFDANDYEDHGVESSSNIILSRDDRTIVKADHSDDDESLKTSWSKNRKRIAALGRYHQKVMLWIVNSRNGRIVYKKHLEDEADYNDVTWLENSKIVLKSITYKEGDYSSKPIIKRKLVLKIPLSVCSNITGGNSTRPPNGGLVLFP